MPPSERVNWQPISQMPLVASMINGAMSDTVDHIQTLTKARAQPHVLDDAIMDRVNASTASRWSLSISMQSRTVVCARTCGSAVVCQPGHYGKLGRQRSTGSGLM